MCVFLYCVCLLTNRCRDTGIAGRRLLILTEVQAVLTLWHVAQHEGCTLAASLYLVGGSSLCSSSRNIKQRTYEGNLTVSVNKRGHLQIINDVEFETYIAGVVQSEIYGTDPDIFRV